MWRADVVLAFAWFIPILLGFLIGFILLRLSDDKLGGARPQAERRRRATDMLPGT